jgi:hypothetical protein
MSTDPFAAPASATAIQWADLNGSLLLIEVHNIEHDIPTTLGKKDAVRADVVVLDGSGQGDTYPDCLIFPKGLQGQLRARIGQKVLGRLGQGVAKAAQSPPWLLSEATDADKRVGMAYLANGLAQPATAPPGGKPPPF